MKAGDLVRVDYHSNHGRARDLFRGFMSIVVAVCTPEMPRNGLHLVSVLEHGQSKWYPVGYIRAINESR